MPPGLASDILEHTYEHLYLVAVSMAIAIAISVPAGILLARRARVRPWAFGFANIMQTVPSLALFGLLIPVPLIGGLRPRMAIFALTLYALLPILRNTMTGILAVDPAVRESAVAMWVKNGEVLWEGGRALAAPATLGGARGRSVATVVTLLVGEGRAPRLRGRLSL